MLKGKRVFISGGNGVIGKELVQLLHEQGAILLVGDLKPRPHFWPAEIRYRQGDLNYMTQGEMDAFAPEYFFHLAATFERSTETYDFWYENHRHNIQLGTHLLTLVKDSASLKKIINCSSYLIYEPNLYYFDQPAEKAYSLKEDDPIYPRNLTGVAKLNHEIELRFLNDFNSERYQSVSARIYRSYGKNSRDIVSRWIRMLLKGETLTVYNKEGLFDYVYAGDVAEGLMRLAANEEAEGIYNLATGKAQRVTDILDALRTHFPDLQTVEKEIDLPYEASEANMEKYEALIGWKPSKTLADAVPLMIAHEKEFGDQDETISEQANVLITSLSKKIPMAQAVAKAAQKFGTHVQVYGGDINADCLGRHFVAKFWHMPRIHELTDEVLLAYCRQEQIKAIIPTRDGELAFWAAKKDALAEQGIAVMISNPDATDICLDKLLFYTSPLTKGFPIIPTSANIDAIEATEYVVKEQFGAGARTIGLRLDKEAALEHAQELQHPIFQPYVEGQEISIDLYIDQDGQRKGCVLRTRDVVVDGESQITTTFEDAQLADLCQRLAEQIGIYGHAVFQAFKTKDGAYHIIEANCRFGGASTLGLKAGVDSFYWFLLEANGESVAQYPFVPAAKTLRQVRFPSDQYLTL
jgi:carbamoyl-phosphate synthase large subunit